METNLHEPIDFNTIENETKNPNWTNQNLNEPFKQVYIPTWHNKPLEVPPVLMLADCNILTYQNITSIIAKQGTGKSSLCEAICASYLNTQTDTLGFKVDNECKGVIYIDSERTDVDVWNSFYRMCKRAEIQQFAEPKNVTIAGLRAVPRLKERLAKINDLLENNPCSLLLIDGAGDLVTDTNDLEQAIECRIWMRELTVKYKVSIITTLHPNPSTDKPRGHLGSELIRESECVFLAKQCEGETRILTSDFEHGKNRNNPNFKTAYQWSDEQKMFITADAENVFLNNSNSSSNPKKERTAKTTEFKPNQLNEDEHTNILNEVFSIHKEQSYADTWRNIKNSVYSISNKSMGDNKAKDFLAYYITKEKIIAINVPKKKTTYVLAGQTETEF